MSTARADVLELLEDGPENHESGEIAPILARITLAKDYPPPAHELSGAQTNLWTVLREIVAPTAKAEILAVLDRLPDDCTMEDILEELEEREDLRQSLASAIYEPLISQEEMEAWVEQWAREERVTTTGEAGTAAVREELPNGHSRKHVDDTSDHEMSASKDQLLDVLKGLPDDCTVEDILHTLYVRLQIKQAIWSLDNEPTFTQEEVEQSLSRWLTN